MPALVADATVPGTFATLAAALANATDGDNDGKTTIQVGAGTFTGAFLVTRDDIVLEGVGPTTILRAPTGTAEIPVLTAEAVGGFELRNLTIQGTAFKPGFEIAEVADLVIDHVTIRLAAEAGAVVGCDAAQLSNLTVVDCGSGILLRDSLGISLMDGSFNSNDLEGVLVRGCTDAVIDNVTCNDNLGAGIFVRRSNSTVIRNSTCSNNLEDGMFVRENVGITIDNCTITDNGGFGVFLRRNVGVDFDAASGGNQGQPGSNTITGNALDATN